MQMWRFFLTQVWSACRLVLLKPKMSAWGCVYLAVAEYNIARLHNIDVGTLAHPSTASESKHGSHQSYKTCSGADELAIRTLLHDETENEQPSRFFIASFAY